ncbi:TPA: ABC transporter permease [Legionella pneumophila]|uniref:Ribose sugar permease-like protein n=1 Tax=Legionella pneumophila subsp. pneumophila TaxID=91891 RepID=A0AAV2UT71_LEGPN|nr:ABC transporter permease [Legionella pneumophila]MCK1849988.1 ABC transporter permease [Legionella pneumophila]MCZ4805686.1 ABC transporter permease [Legionella pneumophila]MDI9852881.1 ABC transporter permease [Legionella pneumophila]MDW8855565.1 ABC transporter permease [Legionella pneumophila]MDW8867766.1 ABC transporter permease [Legionella pneumophila]
MYKIHHYFLFGVLVPFIGLVSLFTIFSSDFLTLTTWASILASASDIGIVVLGVTLLLIGGEFDLSVGANFALSGLLFGSLSLLGINSILALIIALTIGACIGLVNAACTVFFKIPSFIVTLGSMLILRSLILLYTQGLPISIEDTNGVMQVLAGELSQNLLSSFIWWIVIGFYLIYLLNWTKLGNHIIATGNNCDSAYLSGINTMRVKFFCFVCCGIIAAFAGVTQFSHLNSLSPVAGEQYELYAIAATVIGGTSLKGGQGSIISTLLATLLLSTVDTGIVQIGVSTYWYRSFIGLILIFAMTINVYLRKSDS